jgi:hypothetical protein
MKKQDYTPEQKKRAAERHARAVRMATAAAQSGGSIEGLTIQFNKIFAQQDKK